MDPGEQDPSGPALNIVEDMSRDNMQIMNIEVLPHRSSINMRAGSQAGVSELTEYILGELGGML